MPFCEWWTVKLTKCHPCTNIASFFQYLKPYLGGVINLLLAMLIVTVLQAALPFISKAIIDVGIHTGGMNFIELVLIAQMTILLGHHVIQTCITCGACFYMQLLTGFNRLGHTPKK